MLDNQKFFCIEKEKTGRDLFNDLLATSPYYVGFSKDLNNRADFVLLSYEEQNVYGDIKTYRDPKHPRNHNKFDNYQIDYDKLDYIETKAKELGYIPILVCFFSDQLMIWRLDTIDWRNTRKDVGVNQYGGAYGKKKEKAPQAYLEFKDAIYINKDIKMN